MRTRKIFLWLAIVAVVLWTVLDSANRPTQAQSASSPDNAPVIAQLDKVLANQSAILSDLASMKEELRIIKIRITQQQ